jgi:8-amino-7-oxononanoate synthase
MDTLATELQERLARLEAQGLQRQLRRFDGPQSAELRLGDQRLVNFSSNDYLGLASHPAVRSGAISAVERYGAGSGASRLICGSLAIHHALEEKLAEFKGTAAALTFSSGYAAALGTITALLTPRDIIVVDRLAHACIIDAARLSGATLRVFRHNDVEDLERMLDWAARRIGPQPGSAAEAQRPRVLVVTESVFSMDGDLAPLPEVVRLKQAYGAWLMVDEAHATGLYGVRRRGRIEACGLGDQVEVQMGTLGKALGAAGGFICGSRPLIDYLVNRARSLVFSTAPSPAAAGAALAALALVDSACGRMLVDRLKANVSAAGSILRRIQASAAPFDQFEGSAILPILVGQADEAVRLANRLASAGVFLPAIRYPTVPRGKARLRLTVSAGHSAADLEALARAFDQVMREDPSHAHEAAAGGAVSASLANRAQGTARPAPSPVNHE